MTSTVVGLTKLGNKKETRNQKVAPRTLARTIKHRAIGATNVIAIGPLFIRVSQQSHPKSRASSIGFRGEA